MTTSLQIPAKWDAREKYIMNVNTGNTGCSFFPFSLDIFQNISETSEYLTLPNQAQSETNRQYGIFLLQLWNIYKARRTKTWNLHGNYSFISTKKGVTTKCKINPWSSLKNWYYKTTN